MVRINTYPDAQYDDDIEAEGSHGMEAKHEGHYVNGMMGNETLQDRPARVGGDTVELMQKKSLNPVDPDPATQKISVGGDMVQGMRGDEEIRGPAVVTGTNVIYGQSTAKPISNQQKLAQTLAQEEHTVDGVAYNSDPAEVDDMIDEFAHKDDENKNAPMFGQYENAEVIRHQNLALADLEYMRFADGIKRVDATDGGDF